MHEDKVGKSKVLGPILSGFLGTTGKVVNILVGHTALATDKLTICHLKYLLLCMSLTKKGLNLLFEFSLSYSEFSYSCL